VAIPLPVSAETWRSFGLDGCPAVVLHLALDPRQGGGLWVATDQGLWHWDRFSGECRQIQLPEDPAPVAAVAVHPADPAVVYLSISRYPSSPVGLLSVDGGATWARLELCQPWAEVPTLDICRGWFGQPRFDPRDPDRVVFSTEGGAVVCWTPRTPGRCRAETTSSLAASSIRDPRDPDRLLGWSGDTVLESRDDGRSWDVVQSLGGETREIRELVADPARPGTFLARVKGGFSVSRDDGGSWSDAASGLAIDCVMIGSTPSAGYRCTPTPSALLLLWNGRAVVALDDDPGGRLAWSRDGAASWMPLEGIPAASRVTALVWDPVGRALYAGTSGSGVWRLDELPGDPPRRPQGLRRTSGAD